jgi:pimeloyl-ACP methyl ester carboxylesterase
MVASVSPLNSTEGIVGLISASMGYMVVVPDYLGFGSSRIMHPYLHAESLIPCVIDLMRAARSYASTNQISLNGQIYLTGYSEGGYVTLVTQKAIEESYPAEFNLKAVAPLSGPYDLQGMIQSIFQSGHYDSPAYIAFFLTAYNNVYGWNRLNDFFNAPYASKMPGLFDGSKTWGEVVTSLPASFSALMKPAFITDYLAGNEADVQTAVQENTRLNWVPQTPIHFFHGDADEIVPYQNAVTAVETFISNGAANVQLITITGGTHETTGPVAVVGALQWFESM